MRPLRRALALLIAAALLGGCARNLAHVETPGRVAAALTAPPWTSAIYVLRADSAIVVVDLGLYGAERALRCELRSIGARPATMRMPRENLAGAATGSLQATLILSQPHYSEGAMHGSPGRYHIFGIAMHTVGWTVELQ